MAEVGALGSELDEAGSRVFGNGLESLDVAAVVR